MYKCLPMCTNTLPLTGKRDIPPDDGKTYIKFRTATFFSFRCTVELHAENGRAISKLSCELGQCKFRQLLVKCCRFCTLQSSHDLINLESYQFLIALAVADNRQRMHAGYFSPNSNRDTKLNRLSKLLYETTVSDNALQHFCKHNSFLMYKQAWT
jgi:hypothetical protein